MNNHLDAINPFFQWPSLYENWPPTKPGQERGADDDDLTRFTRTYSLDDLPEAELVQLLRNAAGGWAFRDVLAIEERYLRCRLLEYRCNLVWSRVRARWTAIEIGLAAVESGLYGRQALRYAIALGDVHVPFGGDAKAREPLNDLYRALTRQMAWPSGFNPVELCRSFELD
ncbi:hypothetical protein [Methylobacterium brachiatum]|uniref:hypothetical protein n=1 Tax=Methylobacterium brachiatum TaxID=269660 RepID=UPI0013CE8C9B|nr:hypothetical protein [Methylobacterium brachiatum]